VVFYFWKEKMMEYLMVLAVVALVVGLGRDIPVLERDPALVMRG
jgi:hypothetical protein